MTNDLTETERKTMSVAIDLLAVQVNSLCFEFNASDLTKWHAKERLVRINQIADGALKMLGD